MAGLKKNLGLGLLTFNGTGMILGAGIYSIIGKAAGVADHTLWLGFIVAAIVAFVTAFAYAELSTMYPKAGGEYIYPSQVFKTHTWIAKSIGMAMALAGASTATTVSIAFTGYLDQFFASPPMLPALVLLVVASVINLIGVKESGWTNVIFTLIEASGLVLFIYLGWTSEDFGQNLDFDFNWGTLSATSLILFSYFGFENIVNMAEEAKNPVRDLPRAIFISLGVSTVLYVLVSVAALALATPELLSSTDAALMSAARSHSTKIAGVLGAIALFSTANTALIALLGSSRILYGMGSEGGLPKYFSHTLNTRHTPWIATLVSLVIAISLLPLGKIETVASVTSLATLVSFFAVNVTVIALRIQKPKLIRPFRIPGSIGNVPVLAVLGALTSFVFIFQFEVRAYIVVTLIFLVFALIDYLGSKS